VAFFVGALFALAAAAVGALFLRNRSVVVEAVEPEPEPVQALEAA
jgi:hypothetical protein